MSQKMFLFIFFTWGSRKYIILHCGFSSFFHFLYFVFSLLPFNALIFSSASSSPSSSSIPFHTKINFLLTLFFFSLSLSFQYRSTTQQATNWNRTKKKFSFFACCSFCNMLLLYLCCIWCILYPRIIGHITSHSSSSSNTKQPKSFLYFFSIKCYDYDVTICVVYTSM